MLFHHVTHKSKKLSNFVNKNKLFPYFWVTQSSIRRRFSIISFSKASMYDDNDNNNKNNNNTNKRWIKVSLIDRVG